LNFHYAHFPSREEERGGKGGGGKKKTALHPFFKTLISGPFGQSGPRSGEKRKGGEKKKKKREREKRWGATQGISLCLFFRVLRGGGGGRKERRRKVD